MGDSELVEENVKLRTKVTELNDVVAGYKRMIAGSTRKDSVIQELKNEIDTLKNELYKKDTESLDEQQKLLEVIDTLQSSIHKFKVRQERDANELSTLKNELWQLKDEGGGGGTTKGSTRSNGVSEHTTGVTIATQCDIEDERRQGRIEQYESILRTLTEKSRKLQSRRQRMDSNVSRARVDSLAETSFGASPRLSSASDSFPHVSTLSLDSVTPIESFPATPWLNDLHARLYQLQRNVDHETKVVSQVHHGLQDWWKQVQQGLTHEGGDQGRDSDHTIDTVQAATTPMPKLVTRVAVGARSEVGPKEDAKTTPTTTTTTTTNSVDGAVLTTTLDSASDLVAASSSTVQAIATATDTLFRSLLPEQMSRLDGAIEALRAGTAELTADIVETANENNQEEDEDDAFNLSKESAEAIITANALPAWERITSELETAQLELKEAQEAHQRVLAKMQDERDELLDDLDALNELHEFQSSNAAIEQETTPSRRLTTGEGGAAPTMQELEDAHEEVVHSLHMQLMKRAEQALEMEARIRHLESYIEQHHEGGEGAGDKSITAVSVAGPTPQRAFPLLPRSSALNQSGMSIQNSPGAQPNMLEYSLAESEEAILAEIETGDGQDVHERPLTVEESADAEEASFLGEVITLRKRLAKTNFKYLNKTLGQELNFNQLVHLSNTNLDAIAARARRLSLRARAERRDERGRGARTSALAQQISVLIVESAALRKQLNDYAEAAVAATMEKQRQFLEAHGLSEDGGGRRRKSTSATPRQSGFSTIGDRAKENEGGSGKGKNRTGKTQKV